MFKKGDKVQLKSYEECSDYRAHRGQEALIQRRLRSGASGFNWEIGWKDGSGSYVYSKNLKRPNVWGGK